MKSLLKSTFNIVAAVVVLFAAIAVFVAKKTSAQMVEQARKTVENLVKATTGQIDRLMTGVETAVANQKWVISEHLDDPDYMYRITQELVENNAYIVGSTIAFVPNYYPSKGFYWAPYTCDDGSGKLKSFQLGNDENRYHEQGWYADAVKAGSAIWSEPYFDEGGAKIDMSTYSMPIRDSHKNICAILTADLSLEQLKSHVAAIRPFPNSYMVMRSSQGKSLVDPPKDWQSSDGGKTITICDKADNGWTVEVVCPVEEILRDAQKLVVKIIIFSVLGLGMIFIVSWIYSSRLQSSIAMRERMSGELNTARNIQSDILPKNFTSNVYATLRPAREVGGDLYDFVKQGDKLYFIIGDASGKGVPAALFSFMAGTVFRMACSMGLNPGEIVGRINQALAHNNEMSMFVTAFVGSLDLTTGDLEFGCAGHNPPVIISPNGKAQFLSVRRGPPTGAVEGKFFELQKAKIERGSQILIYTDGVTEAERADHSQFGDDRLLKYASTCVGCGVREVVNGLLRNVDEFVAGAEQSDDITIMSIAS